MTTIPAARLTCKCNKVVISIASPPLNRLECCCSDCRKGLAWCASQGGPPPPQLPDLVYFQSAPQLPDLVYFRNALCVDKGFDQLGCYLIKQGYNTRRIVAKCCWTCLLGDHPAYQGLKFVTYPPPAVLTLENKLELMPFQGRIFQNDMSDEELSALPPFVPPLVSSTATPSSSELEELLSNGDYVTTEDLINSIGEVKIMDPSYDGPPTEWNMQFPPHPPKQSAEE